MIKTTSFEVVNNKFWILERKTEVEKGKGKQKIEKESTVIDAWVFSEEPEAISMLRKLIKEEEGEEELEEEDPYEVLAKKYNLQVIEIAPEKYNVKPISWVKIALMLMKGEKVG